MLQLEILILELFPVDGLPTGTISSCEVTALNHKVLNDSVEGRAFIAEAFLTRGKCSEVLSRLRNGLAY